MLNNFMNSVKTDAVKTGAFGIVNNFALITKKINCKISKQNMDDSKLKNLIFQ